MFTVKEIQLRHICGFSVHTEKKRSRSVYGLLPSCISKQTPCPTTLNLFPPLHLVYVYVVYVCLRVCLGGHRGCGCGRLELSTHTDMQQLANKDEFCCVWQRFSVHYFPLCPARIPDLSSCLSCKDTLSGPDSSSHARTHTHQHTPAHTVRIANTHIPLVLKPPPTDSPTYVGNICSDLSH